MPETRADDNRSIIEEWFPINEVGVESLRERIPGIDFPAPNRLHVWFARRPLLTARAAILCSVLPVGLEKNDILRILGIPPGKDLVAIQRAILRSKSEGGKVKGQFSWPPSFTVTPTEEQLRWIREKSYASGLTVLDPMGGGGSIPYEALRLGLPVIAGELNPVAYVVLKTTVEYPARFGAKLIALVEDFCKKIGEEASRELERFYPKEGGEQIYAYLWARTLRCQQCGLQIPLSSNWWVVRDDAPTDVAVRLVFDSKGSDCRFEIVENPKAKGYDPDKGTDVGKDALCPRCKYLNSSESLRREAQAGRLGHQMYCVSTKRQVGGRRKWWFRTPGEEDIRAVMQAEEYLTEKMVVLREKGLVPEQYFPASNNDIRPLEYGMKKWIDFFNPRQLLTHLVYLEKFNEAKKELLKGVRKGTEEGRFAEAIVVYGAIVFDSCVNYNCLLSEWHFTRRSLTNAMKLQGFPFKTDYGEWDHPSKLWPWATSKTVDALRDLVKLLPPSDHSVEIYCKDAASIPLESKSIPCIVVDPPYGENVMYAEVMDFFYVWLKRMLGDIFPEEFKAELTEKEEEAVANPARFRDAPKGMSKKLANQNYQAKMEACFRDMHRVLTDDGIMVVMFTHRTVEAWAGLARSLINSGFTFSASWPVFTEPGQKFGKAQKGVLKVTVLLGCRKRRTAKKGRWEEVKRELYAEAQKKVSEHAALGIEGPDLLVSVYGPVLGRFADYSELKDDAGNTPTAEDALQVVANAVNKYRTADLETVEEETLAYWNLVKSFPSLRVEEDLARVTTVFGGNLNIDNLAIKGGKGYLEKEKGLVKILLSKDRLDRGIITPSRPESINSIVDVVHASLVEYERRGITAVRALLQSSGRDPMDPSFLSLLKKIGQMAYDERASDTLVREARLANALLEALGMQPDLGHKKGESLSHYL